VAIASTGHVPVGGGGTRRPSEQIVDTAVSLLLVLLIAGSFVVAYFLYLNRVASYQRPSETTRTKRRRLLTLLLVIGILIALFVRFGFGDNSRNRRTVITGVTGAGQQVKNRAGDYQPRFATVPVAVVLGVAALGALAVYASYLARRRRLGSQPAPEASLSLAQVLDETLDDLRAEPDPRRAVIAAYARLLRTFTAYGLAPRVSDAPVELLRRIFLELDVASAAASRLTHLFERAKFSRDPVGMEAKEEAIELLQSIRADFQERERQAAAASADAAGAIA
jgi:hypothetical protein